MQHLDLGPEALAKYHAHIQRDHDYQIHAEVLTMNEQAVTEVNLLDGQVNVQSGDNGTYRTATVTLSDPERALDYGVAFANDEDGVLWVNRLLRIQHEVDVPGVGRVVSTPFVGCPTSSQRSGGEVGLELQDKSVLNANGARERSFGRGSYVITVLRVLLQQVCGELHTRIPYTTRKTSRVYAIGMAEGAMSAWGAARYIAAVECGWQLFYTADGWVEMLPSNSQRASMTLDHVIELPSNQASFADFRNYIRVTSTGRANAVAELPPTNKLSAAALARNGVPRLLPAVVSDDNLTSQAKVNARAVTELRTQGALATTPTYETLPVFHLDDGDQVVLPEGIGAVTLGYGGASIPLGVGGNMTWGATRWVSAPVTVKAKRR